jgi:hypothetical protein
MSSNFIRIAVVVIGLAILAVYSYYSWWGPRVGLKPSVVLIVIGIAAAILLTIVRSFAP